MRVKRSLAVVLGTSFFTGMNLLSLQPSVAQGSWGSVDYSQTYTSSDTGQKFCHYDSGVWAPCPSEGSCQRNRDDR
jgi:hypothetical protein